MNKEFGYSFNIQTKKEIDNIKNDINGLNNQIEGIKQNKTDKTVTDNIQQQVDNLSSQVRANSEEIVQARGVHVSLKDRFKSNELKSTQSENKNIEQDNRLNFVNHTNKRQDVAMQGLLNENSDKRLVMTGEGNHLKLEHSKEGMAEVKKVIGNTLVNVCDQKEPVTITKGYTVESGNHVALQGEYDGKCRPILYGWTMVNCIKPIDDSWYVDGSGQTGGVKSIEGNYIKAEKTKEGSFRITCDNNFRVYKPNTEYVLWCDVKQKIVSTESRATSLSIIYSDSTTQYVGSLELGVNLLSFTTQNKPIDKIIFGYNGSFTETGVLEVGDIMAFEGLYTPYKYISGLQNTFEDNKITQEMVDSGIEKAENLGKYKVDYKITGKNKLDEKSQVIFGHWMPGAYQNGKIKFKNNGSERCVYSLKTYFEQGKIYSLSYHNLSGIGKYVNLAVIHPVLPDGSPDMTNTYSFNCGIREFTYPSGNYIIRFYTDNTTVEEYSVNYMLEEVQTIALSTTSYEPYKEFTKTFYLNSPLLEGDTIEQSDNNVVHVHRGKLKILDGSENCSLGSTQGTENNIRFNISLPDVKPHSSLISDKFPNQSGYKNDVEGVYMGGTNGDEFSLYIFKSKLTTLNVQGFKQWLQQNPLTIVYELATPTYETISANDSILCDSYIDGYLDVNTVVPIKKVVFDSPWIPIRHLTPSTKYTVQFESDNIGKLDTIDIGGGILSTQTVLKGVNKFIVTSLSTIVYDRLYLAGVGFNASNIVVTNSTQDFGYFEGMKSTFEDCLVTQEMIDAGTEKAENLGKYKAELKVVGKNLFDISQVGEELPYRANFNNIVSFNNNIFTLEYTSAYPTILIDCTSYLKYWVGLKLKTSCKFEDSTPGIKPSTYLKGFDATGKVYFFQGSGNLVIPSYLTKLELAIIFNNTSNVIAGKGNVSDIQVEIVNEDLSTPYEPYKEHVQTLYLDEPLYKDNELCVHNGQLGYWKNRDSVILNGSEYMQVGSATDDKFLEVVCNIGGTTRDLVISDVFQSKKMHDGVNENIRSTEAGLIIIILKSKLTTPDVKGFKTWLQQKPLTVVYKLAEPIFVPVLENTPQWILNCFDECTLSIDSNIPATSMSAVYTGNVVSVVALEKVQYQQDAVNLDNAYRLTVLEIASGGAI